MSMTVQELADLCGAEIQGGDSGAIITGAGDLGNATPDQVSFYFDPRYAKYLETTGAGALIIKKGMDHPEISTQTARLYVDDPETIFVKILSALHPLYKEVPGIDEQASIADDAEVGRDVYIGPFAVISSGAVIGDGCEIHPHAVVGRNCKVGKSSRLYPHSVLYEGVDLGEEVIVHSGTVVGADGFGYKFVAGRHAKVPQVGDVKVGDQVEIGANSAVDRAAMGSTVIGEGSKIDNLVQIGHNANIGNHCILCGRVGLAGSVNLGDYSVLGASAGIADHVTLAPGTKVGAMSGVHKDTKPQEELFGYPAIGRKEAWRQWAALRKLPELVERVRKLENQLKSSVKDSNTKD